jgi:anti-sigma B factor antagonist
VDEGDFVVTVERASPPVVRVAGELDLAGAPRLMSVLTSLDGDVELHCSALEFIDAAGLSVVVRTHRRCAAQGHKLVVVDPSPTVLRLLRMVDLDDVLYVSRNGEAS